MKKQGNSQGTLVKILDYITLLMMIITLIVAILTTLVVFGILWHENFYNFVLLEVCLSLTLFMWGVTSIVSLTDKKAKKHGFYSIVLGSILISFLFLGVY